MLLVTATPTDGMWVPGVHKKLHVFSRLATAPRAAGNVLQCCDGTDSPDHLRIPVRSQPRALGDAQRVRRALAGGAGAPAGEPADTACRVGPCGTGEVWGYGSVGVWGCSRSRAPPHSHTPILPYRLIHILRTSQEAYRR